MERSGYNRGTAGGSRSRGADRGRCRGRDDGAGNRSRDDGAGNRSGRGEDYLRQHSQPQGQRQGEGGGARGGGRGWGTPQTGGQPWVSRGGRGRGGRGVWSEVPAQSQPQSQIQSLSQRVPEQTLPDIGSLEISNQKPSLSLLESMENRILPIRRPDNGGTRSVWSVRLLANHFLVRYNPEGTIMHYDVDIKPNMAPGTWSTKKVIPKSDLRFIKDKLFSDDPTRFPDRMSAYDGEKNIFSAVPLPTGDFMVELFGGEGMKSRSYIFTVKLVNELKYSKVKDYLNGNLGYIPRDILQGMDVVMKENPSEHRISVGRSFYSKEFRANDDLKCGVAAFRGFQQSLKPTSQGLVLCLDYSVMAFRKRLPVIDFLKEHFIGFKVSDVGKLRREVARALKGLKVTVDHRVTKQKFVIAGLTNQNTKDVTFILEDRDGEDPPREIGLVEYFREKYHKEIIHEDIPCLDLGKGSRKNYVPMEFCTLVEGQRYPKEQLDRDERTALKKISMPPPRERKNTIYEMVQAEDGPCGNVLQNFEIAVEKNMTRAFGRVLEPPALKLRTPTGNVTVITVDEQKCQWNLVGKSVVEGKPLERWALIDFSSFERYRLNHGVFLQNLRNRCKNLGIRVEEPIVSRFTGMREFSSVAKVQQLLESVIQEANKKYKVRLQLIVCVMSQQDHGYKYIKWFSETQIGVLTQCCLVSHANKANNDQYLANLALKINAKLGGSNVELNGWLTGFEGEEHVMFVGADVNHPGAFDASCPSIAAVVATINWPAANRYAARICPQEHRKEKILNFGTMCLDLVNTYARLNKVKPKRIVVFRDGVSEGQFDMVLNEELLDLKRAIYEENYRPTITVIVAQKRHQTRLFLENGRDGGASGNVPPGTVVDTTIVDPHDFDFYLCSHYGLLGTSKPTHYYVLSDEHNFTSDQLQKLIYDLCFTSARCTKPISLVPPVYYADLAAYRGSMFQEVAVELQPPASVSSGALLDERFYKLHPDIQNEMFFI